LEFLTRGVIEQGENAYSASRAWDGAEVLVMKLFHGALWMMREIQLHFGLTELLETWKVGQVRREEAVVQMNAHCQSQAQSG
jgi:hypothetical protein